jgi:hypothetical protein
VRLLYFTTEEIVVCKSKAAKDGHRKDHENKQVCDCPSDCEEKPVYVSIDLERLDDFQEQKLHAKTVKLYFEVLLRCVTDQVDEVLIRVQ